MCSLACSLRERERERGQKRRCQCDCCIFSDHLLATLSGNTYMTWESIPHRSDDRLINDDEVLLTNRMALEEMVDHEIMCCR